MNNQELICGFHAVVTALQNPLRKPGILYLTSNSLAKLAEQDKAKASKISVVKVAELEKIIVAEQGSKSSVSHQGILYKVNHLERISFEQCMKFEKLIALDQVEDVGNIGSIIRAAAAFGIKAVIIPTHGSVGDVARGAINRISSGGSEHCALVRCGNLASSIEIAKNNGYTVTGFCENAPSFISFKPIDKHLMVFGSEHKGLRQLVRKKCDMLSSIPVQNDQGFVTLNVAQSVVAALTCELAQRSI